MVVNDNACSLDACVAWSPIASKLGSYRLAPKGIHPPSNLNKEY